METSNFFHGCEKNASPWQKQEDKQPQLRWLIGLLWITTISHLYDLFITIPSTQKPSRRCWYTIRVLKKHQRNPTCEHPKKIASFRCGCISEALSVMQNPLNCRRFFLGHVNRSLLVSFKITSLYFCWWPDVYIGIVTCMGMYQSLDS